MDLEAYSASELVRDIFQKAHTKLDADAPVSNELHELYEGAMAFERKSISLYQGQVQEAENVNQKAFFEFLAEQ